MKMIWVWVINEGAGWDAGIYPVAYQNVDGVLQWAESRGFAVTEVGGQCPY